jgi:hypothetical protein
MRAMIMQTRLIIFLEIIILVLLIPACTLPLQLDEYFGITLISTPTTTPNVTRTPSITRTPTITPSPTITPTATLIPIESSDQVIDSHDPNYLGYYVIDRQMGYQFILPGGWSHPSILNISNLVFEILDDDSVIIESWYMRSNIEFTLSYAATYNSLNKILDIRTTATYITNVLNTPLVFYEVHMSAIPGMSGYSRYHIFFQPDPDSFLIWIKITSHWRTTFYSEDRQTIQIIQDSIKILDP